jgi:maltose alpha-D-glucosyltransferase / alpha-amylase
MENDARSIELAHCLLLTMPGTPIMYYGDEIGMGDNIWLDDRNGVRTPMQWTPTDTGDRTGGFSANPAGKPFSPLVDAAPFNNNFVNVRDAMSDSSNIFHTIKFMIRMRKNHPCFSRGTLTWIPSNPPSA